MIDNNQSEQQPHLQQPHNTTTLSFYKLLSTQDGKVLDVPRGQDRGGAQGLGRDEGGHEDGHDGHEDRGPLCADQPQRPCGRGGAESGHCGGARGHVV